MSKNYHRLRSQRSGIFLSNVPVRALDRRDHLLYHAFDVPAHRLYIAAGGDPNRISARLLLKSCDVRALEDVECTLRHPELGHDGHALPAVEEPELVPLVRRVHHQDAWDGNVDRWKENRRHNAGGIVHAAPCNFIEGNLLQPGIG